MATPWGRLLGECARKWEKQNNLKQLEGQRVTDDC